MTEFRHSYVLTYIAFTGSCLWTESIQMKGNEMKSKVPLNLRSIITVLAQLFEKVTHLSC